MREQIYHLASTTLIDKGLVEAVVQHCNLLKNRYGLAIELTADSELSFSIDQREALYYVAREALWNVVKHAGATHVNVSLTSQDDQIALSIMDNGAGFDPSAFVREETLGLRNMEERAKLLGGGLEIQSKPGQGSQISVHIPKRGEAQANIDESLRIAN